MKQQMSLPKKEPPKEPLLMNVDMWRGQKENVNKKEEAVEKEREQGRQRQKER